MNWIKAAAISGFLAIILGAFGAHMLQAQLSNLGMEVYRTAVLYHLIHTLALLGFGVLSLLLPGTKKWSGYCFVLGIILFSGSLYALALTQIRLFGIITPIGGACFLLGWAGLFFQDVTKLPFEIKEKNS